MCLYNFVTLVYVDIFQDRGILNDDIQWKKSHINFKYTFVFLNYFQKGYPYSLVFKEFRSMSY